jgi:TolB-like protein/DNA-binding winged helix-turn-helix (wHTH) protein
MTQDDGRLRIGDYCVDPGRDQISREGVAAKLEPRTMRLLLYLAARNQKPTGVNELLDVVWSDVIVSPDSVYQAIASLRRAFGDDARDPRYILNVPRRGYRLVADVEPWHDARPGAAPIPAAAPAPSEAIAPAMLREPAPTPRGTARLSAWLAVTAAALIAAGSAGFLRLQRAPPTPPTAASIAVLPFEDLSPAHDQAYLAEGLADEIIAVLARVPDLKVPARTSAFYFKGRAATIAQIGQALGVQQVLEGSLRRYGDRVRVTTDLVRVADGVRLWSESYDRELQDILALEDQIAASVVRSLTAQLLPNTPRPDRPSANPAAYTQQLLARSLRWHDSQVDTRQAVALLQQALGADPGNAQAWAELASAYVFLSQSADAVPDDDMRLARAAAQRALLLEPGNSLAHEALGEVKLSYDFDVPGAVTEFEAARAADPNTPAAGWLTLYSGCLAGPCFEAFVHDLDGQVARDPLNAGAFAKRAFVLFYGGDYAGAERDYLRTFELSPELVSAHFVLTAVRIARHDLAGALESAGREPDSYWRRAAFALAYHALGRRDEADHVLTEMIRLDAEGAAYQIAEVCAVRGDADAAFRWLERAWRQHDSGLTLLKVDPLLARLHGDPRLAAFVRRMNLPT